VTAIALPLEQKSQSKSQWQVVWEQFQKQPQAIFALCILFALYLGALFAPFLTPYDRQESFAVEGVRYQAPTQVHFWADGRLQAPFIYATTRKVDLQTFETKFLEDKSQKYPIRFFAQRGEPYLLFGILETRLRLISVESPARLFLMGSDGTGRDIFSRVILGAQISLTIGFVAVGISFLIGAVLGGLAGYYGGFLDSLLMRFAEVVQAIPPFFLLIALSALIPSLLPPEQYFFGVIIMLGLTTWMDLAKAIRGQVLSIREQEFIVSAKALGISEGRIILRHILPNTASYLVVLGSITIPGAILAESGLSFIGRGVREPAVSWGSMISDITQNGVAGLNLHPWALTPGWYILVTIVAWNVLGDGLRAAFDPKKRR
jgi:peptide/nickel transport system permease protein